MSINPVSDIVLDVARAADPSKAAAVTEALSQLSVAKAAGVAFSRVIQAKNVSDAELRSVAAKMSGGTSTAAPAPRDARSKAYKGVEELVLQKLVETMLPKEDSGVFGSGTAGDIWRSMLAEQLAKQIGKTVDLGLVKPTQAGRAATPVDAHPIARPDILTERQS